MSIEKARDFGMRFLTNHPEHKEEVSGLYQLMKDEIEEGESVTNEVELFIGACEDLLIED
jgi:hypothetical protein